MDWPIYNPMKGFRPARVIYDEARAFQDPAGPSSMPPYDTSVTAKPGDEVVVLFGEQQGWRGTVSSRLSNTRGFNVILTRPDGTKTNPIAQREDAVAVVLKEVPRFTDPEEADAWMASQRAPVQEYASGTMVVFSCPPHLAMRIGGVTFDQLQAQRAWLERHEDLEATGKVARFMPDWDSGIGSRSPSVRVPKIDVGHGFNQPGYGLLVLFDGEPELVEVAAYRIKRLA